MGKIIYSCNHQKNSVNPCLICKEERKKQQFGNGNSEIGFHCDKCGELIKEGSWYSIVEDNVLYGAEEWKQDHSDCQPDPEKVKKYEELEKEIAKERKEKLEREREKTEPLEIQCDWCKKSLNHNIFYC